MQSGAMSMSKSPFKFGELRDAEIRQAGMASLIQVAVGRRGYPPPEREKVGVGITITHDPLHGSGRAGFPHPALALGDNAHTPQRIGMTDRGQRQPASDETPHTIPKDAAVLAPPRQRAMPKPADSEPKK